MACENGHFHVVKTLLSDPRVDPSSEINLYSSSANGRIEVVKLLLADPRVDPRQSDCISVAAEYGNLAVVKALLADGRANPCADDNYAIQMAYQNEHTEVVRLLLADPRVDIGTHLRKGKRGTCSICLKSTVSITSCGHHFHKVCLAMWLLAGLQGEPASAGSQTCPMCRQDISDEKAKNNC